MLTKLIEKSGRNDWLFMKDCYIKLQGGARIIEEVEALISQGMNICYMFKFKESRSSFNSSCHEKQVKSIIGYNKRKAYIGNVGFSKLSKRLLMILINAYH